MNICWLPTMQAFILVWFICLQWRAGVSVRVLARSNGTLQLSNWREFNAGLFTNAWAGFMITKKGQCSTSGIVTRIDHTLNGKGERAVTRILERVLWPEIHSQPGREGTKIWIALIIHSFCLMFSLCAPPTGWPVWKPGTRVPVNAFQKGHHLPGPRW